MTDSVPRASAARAGFSSAGTSPLIAQMVGAGVLIQAARRLEARKHGTLSIPLGFIGCWLGTVLSKEEAKVEREFQGLYVRSETGPRRGGHRQRRAAATDRARGDRDDHAGRRLTKGGEEIPAPPSHSAAPGLTGPLFVRSRCPASRVPSWEGD